MIAADVLGAVDVAQGHIVKALKHGRVHIVAAAHGDLLGFAGGGASDELVGQQHVAAGEVRSHVPDGRPDGAGIAFDGLVGETALHMDGLHKGQQPEGDCAVLVGQRDGFNISAVNRRDMDAGTLHQPPTEGQTLRAVMVAADDQHREVPLRQTAEEIVQQGHRLCGGNGLVIDVAGDQHGVGMLAVNDSDNLGENGCLLFDHGNFINPLANVQVGQVN